jgi:hypothetical protein
MQGNARGTRIRGSQAPTGGPRKPIGPRPSQGRLGGLDPRQGRERNAPCEPTARHACVRDAREQARPVTVGGERQDEAARRQAHGVVQVGVKLTAGLRSGERRPRGGATRRGGAGGRSSPEALHGGEERGVRVQIEGGG